METGHAAARATVDDVLTGANDFIFTLFVENDLDYEKTYRQLGLNSTLPVRTWEEVDGMVFEQMVEASPLNTALRGRAGNVATPDLATTVYTTELRQRLGKAHRVMNTLDQGVRQDLRFVNVSTPLPMHFLDTNFDMRKIRAIRQGQSVDLQWASEAGRSIGVSMEDMIINGDAAIVVANERNANSNIYGLNTHPSAIPVTGTAWTTLGAMFANIEAAILELTQRYFRGPYWVVAAHDVWSFGNARNLSSSEDVGWDILRRDSRIELATYSDFLPSGVCLVFMPLPSMIRILESAATQTAEWTLMGPMGTAMRTFAIMAPEIKTEAQGNMPLAKITGITNA